MHIESAQPLANRRPTPVSGVGPAGALALALALTLVLSGCRQNGKSRRGGVISPTNNQLELSVDFGLRRDLVLGQRSLGDLLHVDLDGDAFTDLVETNFRPMKVTIALGQADGSFLSAMELDTIGHPWKLSAGDYDADGMLDLAVATHRWPAKGPNGTGTAAVQVFLQGPAAGQFDQSPITLSTLNNPIDIASAPRNAIKDTGGPGNQDQIFVALRDRAEVVQMELDLSPGQGTPLVQVRAIQSDTLGAAGGPTSLALLDFDHDGLLDLLVGETQVPAAGDRLVRYHRTQGLGFHTAEFAVGPLFTPFIENVGDVDGDGRDDLSIAQMGDTRIYLVTFDDSAIPVLSTLDLGAVTTSLLFRDLDGDDLAEVVATTLAEDSIQVLPGTGPLAWGEAVHYGVGASPRAIGVTFLPGDGVPDLLCANTQDVSVLLGLVDNGGQPTGTFRAARGYRTTPAGYPTMQHPSAVAMADLDKDGNQDLVTVSRRQFAISFLQGDGHGAFEAVKALPLVATQDDKPGYLEIADVDADGFLDVLTTVEASDELRLYRGTGSLAGFVEPGPLDVTPVASGPLGLAVGHMDAGAGPDVVVANAGAQAVQVLLNMGDGRFTPRVPVAVGFHAGGVILGEFDAVPGQDAVVAGQDGGGQWLAGMLSGDGLGNLTFQGTWPLDGPTSSLASADFNEDGRLDFAVGQGRSSGNELYVFLNQGGLGFNATKVAAGPGPGHVIPADLDNDDNLDLLVATTPGELRVRKGDGQGAFPEIVPSDVGQLPLSHLTIHAAFGDVDGNGLGDVVTVSSQTPFVWVGLNTSTPIQQP